MFCGFLRVIAFFLVLACQSFSMADACFTVGEPLIQTDPSGRKTILILNSYHKGFAWTDSICSGIEDTLESNDSDAVIHYRYMDIRRVSDDLYFDLFLEMLRYQVSPEKYDAVVCSDGHALRFLLKHQQELVPGIPIVFCGMNCQDNDGFSGNPLVTGVADPINIRGTIDAALTIDPSVKSVYCIIDTSAGGNASLKLLREIIPVYRDRLAFEILESLSIDETRRIAGNLPEKSIVLLFHFISGREDCFFSLERGADLITEVCNRPVYSFWDFYLGHGILGGKVSSGYSQGKKAARQLLRVLGGESPADIPVIGSGTTRLVFDHTVMKRFGIGRVQLPERSTVVNVPPTFYDRNQTLIWLVGGGIVLMILIAVSVVINLLERQANAERSLKKSEAKFKTLMETTRDWIWEVDTEGVYTYVNPRVKDLLGYEPAEILGKTAFDLMPEHEAERNRRSFQGFVESRRPILRFVNRNLHKDGHEVLIETTGVPITDSQGNFSGFRGVDRDITEQKKAEDALRESEEKFRIINDSAKDAIIMINASGDVVSWNPAAEKIFGYTVGEIVGIPVHDVLMPEQYREVFERNFEEFRKTGRGNSIGRVLELTAKQKGGTVIPIEISLSTIQIRNQYWATAIIRDITHRKQTETELKSLRNYLLKILNAMPSVLIGLDSRLCITQWNRRAEIETGISADEALGRSVTDVFPRMTRYQYRIKESIQSNQIKSFSKQCFTQGKKTRYEDLTIFPVGSDGEAGAVIRLDDVTERVQIDELMIQSEKMMSIGGLAAGMAHEINNPLASMMQNAQVLINRLTRPMPVNEAAAAKAGTTMGAIRDFMEKRDIIKLLAMIHSAGIRAAKIVENMLSFARKSETARSLNHVSEILDSTIELVSSDYNLKKKYDFKQICIVRQYDEATPAIFCDRSKIQQVFFNILKNCSEAMSDAVQPGQQREFHLRIAEEHPMVRIELSDNGPGMDPEIRNRIFEPFFTTKGDGKGTGLGLSVSYFIVVNDHQGEMSVESTPGQGSTFIIKLPIDNRSGKERGVRDE